MTAQQIPPSTVCRGSIVYLFQRHGLDFISRQRVKVRGNPDSKERSLSLLRERTESGTDGVWCLTFSQKEWDGEQDCKRCWLGKCDDRSRPKYGWSYS